MRDSLLIFGEDIDATGVAADYTSDTLELEYPGKGEGTVLWWVVRLKTDFAGGTSCQFILEDSADDATYRERITTDVILVADLLAGTEIKIGIHYDLLQYVNVIARTLGTFTQATDENLFDSWIEID